MVHLAILGFGTVGSGVYQFLESNRERVRQRANADVGIMRILDVKDRLDGSANAFLTHNAADILDNPDISIVAECMGGLEPAYTYVKTALMNGKSVVTSNKELVAAHGGELLALAKANAVNFLFEASVGGGIPILRPLEQSLTLDEITGVAGIMNGTTNYILTNMHRHGAGFDDALRQAQAMGFAEQDPSADVGGFDTCRKLAILLSIILGQQIDYRDIPTKGITQITASDFARAGEAGQTIKLLGAAKMDGGQLYARVAPLWLDTRHPLANTHNEYNAIMVKCRNAGDMMFYGKGAGQLPSAAAVISDVCVCARQPNQFTGREWGQEKIKVLPLDGDGGMFTC